MIIGSVAKIFSSYFEAIIDTFMYYPRFGRSTFHFWSFLKIAILKWWSLIVCSCEVYIWSKYNLSC